MFSHFPKRFSQLAKFSQKKQKKAASKEPVLHATQVRFQVVAMFHSRSLLVPFSFPSILALRSTDCHPRFRDIMPCSHFVPFSFPFCSLFVPFLFPHFFCSEEYCTPPKLDVFPFHSLLVRSFFTSDEYCTTPKLPCCVLAFPSRSPLPPSFFQL
jgi:hypothetical protein